MKSTNISIKEVRKNFLKCGQIYIKSLKKEMEIATLKRIGAQ